MADELKDLEEGYTNFGNSGQNTSTYYVPTGPIGKFFAKFFATKAIPALNREISGSGGPVPAQGDTIVTTDVIKEGGVAGSVSRNPVMPQTEMNRKKRYRDYEEMDEYPEIGSAFDIYADDCCQKGQKGERWTIDADNSAAVEEVNRLFEHIRMDKIIWDIARNTCKYGDCFTEMIVNVDKPKEGIKKLKVLNPNFIIRVEDEYGYLKKFLQEVPDLNSVDTYGAGYGPEKPVKYIELDRHQIVHFRLHTSDPLFYPYGKSIAALCHRTFRNLKMMEDAMMIYRLSRAPERRIFYVDTGNLPTSKAEMFIERIKQKFKKEKFYQNNSSQVNARYNPMSMDEDFFVATRNGKGTKIDTLPGAQNLGEIEDVRYYRDKLLAALKIPKDFIVEKDSSPERKANLASLDVKFARTIQRIQIDVQTGLENIAKRHLQLRGYPASIIKKLRIFLPEPSDMSAKRKLDLDEQKTRVVQAVKGLDLIPDEQLYKEYFDYTEQEIEVIKSQMEEQREKAQEMEAKSASVAGGGGGAPPGGGPGYGEAGLNGGAEGAENVPPTANESIDPIAYVLESSLMDENQRRVLTRIIEKQNL